MAKKTKTPAPVTDVISQGPITETSESLVPEKHPLAPYGTADVQTNIEYLDVFDVQPAQFNPRREFVGKDVSEIEPLLGEDFINSVCEHGVQVPVKVRRLLDRDELLYGERRTWASRIAVHRGFESRRLLPCIIVIGMSDREAEQIALIENVMRKNISLIDEAMAYRRLRDVHGMTVDDIATRCGRSRSAVYAALRVSELPDEVTSLIGSGRLTYSHGVALAPVQDYQNQHGKSEAIEWANIAAENGYDSKYLEGELAVWLAERQKVEAENDAIDKPTLPMDDEPAAQDTVSNDDDDPFETAPDEPETAVAATKTAKPTKAPTKPTAKKPVPAKPVKSQEQVKADKAATKVAPATPPPAPPKVTVPEGYIAVNIPLDKCLATQDAGLTIDDVFDIILSMISAGASRGLTAYDVLSTAEAALLPEEAHTPVEAAE